MFISSIFEHIGHIGCYVTDLEHLNAVLWSGVKKQNVQNDNLDIQLWLLVFKSDTDCILQYIKIQYHLPHIEYMVKSQY